jgi:serine protease AprX
MSVERERIERLVFGDATSRRFTQDSPVLPDVWIAFATEDPDANGGRVDLLLTPHRDATPGDVFRRLAAAFGPATGATAKRKAALRKLAYNQTTIALRASFSELVGRVLPTTAWWAALEGAALVEACSDAATRRAIAARIAEVSRREGEAPTTIRSGSKTNARASDLAARLRPEALWLVRVAGAVARLRSTARRSNPAFAERAVKVDEGLVRAFFVAAQEAIEPRIAADDPDRGRLVHSISRNRAVRPSISESVLAIKADATRRLFAIDCSSLCWAVLDSGIDAEHPAFARSGTEAERKGGGARPAGARASPSSRVERVFDFTNVRDLLGGSVDDLQDDGDADLRARLLEGRPVDWDLLERRIEMTRGGKRAKGGKTYAPPKSDHGTHVAGILAANWSPEATPPPPDGEALTGVCPDLRLYDLRVLKDDGSGDEFSVMAALQFVRYLNESRDRRAVHGVNMSLAMKHDVANFACGRTPVCEECERVVASGVVVVAAAGNEGYRRVSTPSGDTESYQSISIADPGNADAVITVGATHRSKPHVYGVSYFSSRGPTGDGRVKPDLVAPGEKILSTTPGGGSAVKDGTSMAAPHVSGAAALLMARHRELLGKPQRVKKILCDAATDLGRERYFQGGGMLDVLRAIQSV